MNFRAVRAIYLFEMARTWRTLLQSVISPVITTSLYFIVFGTAIGSRIPDGRGGFLRVVHYSWPDHADAFDAMHQQRVDRHLFPEIHRHDLRDIFRTVCYYEIIIGYVGAAATKCLIIGLIILATASLSCRCISCFMVVLLPGADGDDLQPVRLHHRHLGRRF